MPDRSPRKVLVVTYFFPPLGGAGVQRMLKFVKYLPEHGFQPIVLTTRSQDYPAKDPSLLADVPNRTTINRARDPALLRWARTGFDYLDRPLLRALSGWPDEATAWIPAATICALRSVRRHRPSVILSSAPPFSAHLVAWLTARATGLPWVADFRDEFTANPRAEWRTDFVQRLNAFVERRVVPGATRVVTAADYFVISGVAADSGRRATITNGVDPADLNGPSEQRDSQRFRLSFVGTLYGDLDIAPVTRALRRLAAQGAINPSRCEVRVVGSMWLEEKPDAGEIPVTETGYVSHRDALAQMRDATVLLFYVPASSPAPSGKIFEYLACERPVLCIARRDNLAYHLVEEWAAGLAAQPSDDVAIEAAIAELYARWEAGKLAVPRDVRRRVLERYSRRKLTGELVDVLEEAVGSGVADAEREASPR
jgi:glycosyltransferase involved in cell wall biosynthesis